MHSHLFASLARTCALVFFAVALASSPPAFATGSSTTPLPTGSARELGFAPERLEWMHTDFRRLVDERQVSGFVTLLARHGRIADFRAYGFRDEEARAPMERDTIVRIYSNTKLITSVGAMILFEEGRLDLDAPVARYLPELESPKVLTGGTADTPELAEATQTMRVWHLLTHTAGYAYDFGGTDTLSQLYRRADLWSATSSAEFVARASRLPLAHQPGAVFLYGIHTDLLGAIVERISGQSLGEFLQQRLFGPLKMPDTSFAVDPAKRSRLAQVYRREGGRLIAQDVGRELGFASGGGGLFSTAGDYARFAQMLLNGGELDGVRILGRRTVDTMTLNHLSLTSRPTHAYSQSRGFGLGAEVVIDPSKDSMICSVGQYGWSGMATTYCQIDPREDLVAIAFFQHLPMNEPRVFQRFANGYSVALVDAAKRDPR